MFKSAKLIVVGCLSLAACAPSAQPVLKMEPTQKPLRAIPASTRNSVQNSQLPNSNEYSQENDVNYVDLGEVSTSRAPLIQEPVVMSAIGQEKAKPPSDADLEGCKYYRSQIDAQLALKYDNFIPDEKLDADGNGFACDHLP